MPDFNFAQGNRKREEETSTPAGWRQTTGQQRPVSAHPQGSSDAYSAAPERSLRDAVDSQAGAASKAGPAASGMTGRTMRQSPSGSVLDKYPEHDLSRLTAGTAATGHPSPLDSSAGPGPSAPSGTSEPTATAEDHNDALYSNNTAGGSMSSSSGRGPLITILAIVLLLILIAFVWHVNPWPSLKERIAGFFGAKETGTSVVEGQPPAAPAEAEDADAADAAEMRSWDFFLQVSSWKELGRADLDAERYRAQGFDVIVESEFLPSKGGTWYRVRLGPYESSKAAREVLASGAGVLPNGAYVDSVRLAEDQPIAAPQQDPGSAPAEKRGVRSSSAPAGGAQRTPGQRMAGQRLPGRDFSVVDEPMSGWAVKVSSLKAEELARGEARRLLEQGYPSFITRKSIGGTTWYRVLVGPFSDKRDADRYQQLLNVTYGNDAYTIDLSAE